VMATQRLSDYPDLPTVGEAVPALAGFESKGWYALMAPAGTPEAIVTKVSRDLTTVLGQGELKQKLLSLGTDVRPLSPAQVGELIQSEQATWKSVVRKAVVEGQ
jgi:tripartite-type tricarboxylate transporter receptor subunit TctC